jgi:hypothetical protein
VAPAGICGRSAVAAYCLGLLERDLPGKHGTVGLLADLPLSAPDPADAKRRSRNASRAATLGNSKIGAEIRSTRLLVRDIVELTISGDLDLLIRKRLAEIAQLLQVYARLAELEIAAGERPRGGPRARLRGKSRGRHSWGGSRPSAKTRGRRWRHWSRQPTAGAPRMFVPFYRLGLSENLASTSFGE